MVEFPSSGEIYGQLHGLFMVSSETIISASCDLLVSEILPVEKLKRHDFQLILILNHLFAVALRRNTDNRKV